MTRPIIIPATSTSSSYRSMHAHSFCLVSDGHLTCYCGARQGVTFYEDERDEDEDHDDEKDVVLT